MGVLSFWSGFDLIQNITLVLDCTVDDAGDYEIIATNILGPKSSPVFIVIYDKPGPPKGPIRFDSITANSIVLSWEQPLATGGCPISNYVVEKREATSTVRDST